MSYAARASQPRAARSRPSFKSRMSDCQSDDAGASPADRTSFQKPPIETHNADGGRQLAQQSLQNFAGSGQHRDAVPFYSNRGGARWEGSGLISRLRAGSIPAPATSFLSGRSIIQEVTRLASGRARCKAVAVHHFNREKVENQGSLISFLIVVRLHVPQPWVGSRVKIASRL